MTEILDARTDVGAVTLKVGDLDGMTDYYSRGIGLQVLGAEGDRVALGRRGVPAVVLEHTPLLKHAPSSAAGLFHTAILFDQQADLASSVFSVARHFPASFTGSSDHLVSKALYFDDPEGNGVELYWDRDRSAWSWTHGRVEMATLMLDPRAFLVEHLPDDGHAVTQGPARVGHVHLSVGDVATARDFYVERLGFETTAELGGSALFVSAGGYHHHMAMNTWRSAGARKRRPTLGLGLVRIKVPTVDDLGSLGERLDHYGVSNRDDGRIVGFEDPWANRIEVTAESA